METRTLAWIMITLWGAALCAGWWRSLKAEPPRDGVVVLVNGRVLRGDVTYLGDRCLIELASGGEIRLPAKEVAVHCRTMKEAYLYLRTQILSPNKAKPHLELASWCIRENLLDEATAELTEAMRLEPQHPDIDVLYRRLQQIAQSRTQQESRSTPSESASSDSKSTFAAHDILETTVRSLSKDAVEQFTTTIQPLLVNRCMGSACHESNHSRTSYFLLKPQPGSAFWRRLTLRNLYNTLQQVDSGTPDSSPLLVKASTPHGPLVTAVLGDKEGPQYRALLDWVRKASRGSSTSVAPVVTVGATTTSPRTAVIDGTVVPIPTTADSVPAQPAEQPAVPQKSGQDPFDPELFNSQFGAGRP